MTDKENKSRFTPDHVRSIVASSISRRGRKENMFQWFGKVSVLVAVSFLVLMLFTILTKGLPGFFQYYVKLDVVLDKERLDPRADGSSQSIYEGDYRSAVRESLFEVLNPSGRKEKKEAGKIISSAAEEFLRAYVLSKPENLGTTQTIWFVVDDDTDSFLRGFIDRNSPQSERPRFSDLRIKFVDDLQEADRISYRFSEYLIFGSASRDPEMAGIWGALVGSVLTLSVCLAIAFPMGVATAIYLEEIAPKNRITELIEVNINNLAAVPSVVFGIMGLAIFINFFGLPRSIPLVGGLVLALMTLPTIIISSRAAIRAVPPSIRDGALAVGASKMQTIFHHVIPLAMPGMLTGTIIGMAQALGETAPLLMIGMVAFVVDIPGDIVTPSTVLPVQIFMWADEAERMFVHKTSAAILVLLIFLIGMNSVAVFLRKHLERRW